MMYEGNVAPSAPTVYLADAAVASSRAARRVRTAVVVVGAAVWSGAAARGGGARLMGLCGARHADVPFDRNAHDMTVMGAARHAGSGTRHAPPPPVGASSGDDSGEAPLWTSCWAERQPLAVESRAPNALLGFW